MLGDDLNLTSLELQKYHLPGTTVLDAAEITPVGAALRLPVDLVAQLEQLLARADRDEDRWKDANVTLFKPTSLNKNREKNKKKSKMASQITLFALPEVLKLWFHL